MDKQLFRAIGYNTVKIALAVYFGFLISRATFDNFAKSEEILDKKQAITALKDDINYRKNLLQYYQSPVFLELEARRQLNYKAADERVIVLGERDTVQSLTAQNSTTQEGQAEGDRSDNVPNYLKWWQYFNQ